MFRRKSQMWTLSYQPGRCDTRTERTPPPPFPRDQRRALTLDLGSGLVFTAAGKSQINPNMLKLHIYSVFQARFSGN